jgi:hypothetical protein
VNDRLKHRAGNSAIAPYDNRCLATRARQRPGAKPSGKLGHDLRRERFTDAASYTGDTHHQSFIRHSRFSPRCYWDDGAARNLLVQKFLGRRMRVFRLINFPLNPHVTGE